MIRAYFKINILEVDSDYRPVKWPIKYPYWCVGESNEDFFLVAYVDNLNQIKELWPEAFDIESTKVDKITFTSRFPKPEWFHESDKTNNK